MSRMQEGICIMPLYEVECKSCGKKTEVLTLRISEELPKCDCGGTYKILPSTFTFRWALDEGCWEEVDGRQKYMGKGGKQVVLGGEKLDVHSGIPEQAEKPQEHHKYEEEDVKEFDTSTLPEGVDY